VHLYGKDLIKEKKDAVLAERATWRAKCVVDNPGTMEYPTGMKGMNVALPRKDYAEIPVVDRYKSILHDPPVKLGITGKRVKGAEHPAPVSMYLHEDPEVTNPHSKLNLLSLREIDTTRFTAGDLSGITSCGLGICTPGRWTSWARRTTGGTRWRGTGAIAACEGSK
jgi:hypothetical protein